MIETILKHLGYVKASQQPRRQRILFQAAKSDRLVSRWATGSVPFDEAVFWDLQALRARSRELAANNPYMKRFVSTVRKNVVGHAGIRYQSRVRTPGGDSDPVNELLERAWTRFSRGVNFDARGRFSRPTMERLAIGTLCTDGESLHMVEGEPPRVKSIDPDRIDVRFTDRNRENGNPITMGIEHTDDGEVVAYHLLSKLPGHTITAASPLSVRHDRIEARFIVHAFLPTSPEQSRGIPWAHAAMVALHQLGEYRQSALIAARLGSDRQGYWKVPGGEAHAVATDVEVGDEDEASTPGADGEDDGRLTQAGVLFDDSEPGETRAVPDDWEFEHWDGDYPRGEFKDFQHAMLLGIASGFDIFSPTLTNDYAGINLSSIRGGMTDDRETWRTLQAHFIDDWWSRRLFEIWLRFHVFSPRGQADGLDPLRLDEYAEGARFTGRRWASPDPLKDAQTDALRFGLRVRSLHDIAESEGNDWEETVEQIARETRKLAELGIPAMVPTALQAEGETSDDGDGDGMPAPAPPRKLNGGTRHAKA
jgi:lambda family phage portal protein